MKHTFKLSRREKTKGGRGHHSTLTVQAPLQGLEPRIARLEASLLHKKVLQLTGPSQWLLIALPPPRNPQGPDPPLPLARGDFGLPNHVSQKGEKQPYLKGAQNKSYKINTNSCRNQRPGLYVVNTVNKALNNVPGCVQLLDKTPHAPRRGDHTLEASSPPGSTESPDGWAPWPEFLIQKVWGAGNSPLQQGLRWCSAAAASPGTAPGKALHWLGKQLGAPLRHKGKKGHV